MTPFFARCSLFLVAVTFSFMVSASPADDDLRHAAKLHKRGETPQAMVIWQQWAAQGNADAAYNLALIHHHADGVALDYGQAMQWYRLAAEQGDKVSQVQIGLMYLTGLGVAVDEPEAHRWFTMNAQHHRHHQHDPKLLAWRQQALALIEARDLREQLAAARHTSSQVLADLKRRAGMTGEQETKTAALAATTTIR